MDIDRAGNLYLVGEMQDAGLRPDLLIEKIGNVPLTPPTPTPTPQPGLLELILDKSDPLETRVVALDSVVLLRDPFPLESMAGSFNNLLDQNTRVIIFVRKLSLIGGETPASVIVSLIDSSGHTRDVAAEDVRSLSGVDFVQVVFRLPADLPVGTHNLKVKAHGLVSNSGTIRIKQE